MLDRGAKPARGPAAAPARGRPRPPSATWCWPPRRRPGWCARARRCPTRGRPRPVTCSSGCSRPGPGCSASGRRSTRPGRWSWSCPSGSGCGCCRTPRSVHRFTVDRHLVETCIEASTLIRRVARPDVLMVAALLHDIGKGQLTEHCVAGEPIAREIAERIGFDQREVELIGELVRWHLLLPETATTRDPDDPATVELVTAKVADREELELLAALTEADARATSEKAWTKLAGLADPHARTPGRGRARRRTRARRRGRRDRAPRAGAGGPRRRLGGRDRESARRTGRGSPSSPRDRIGLLADAAAMLALQKVVGAGGAGLDAGRVRRLGLGRRRDRARRHPAAPAARGDHRRPHRRRRAAEPGHARSSWSPRSPYAPRRRRAPP